jgi:hypothetical protein
MQHLLRVYRARSSDVGHVQDPGVGRSASAMVTGPDRMSVIGRARWPLFDRFVRGIGHMAQGTAADRARSADTLVENFVEALAELRRATTVLERSTRRSLKKLREKGDVSAALALAQPAEMRQSLNNAITQVEVARHAIRLAVFDEGLRQGMTIGELGRQFGFSRQLAARYAKESRAGS